MTKVNAMKTDYENHPHNYVLTDDEEGNKHAVNAINTLTVLNDGKTKMFQRRAIKNVGSGESTFETCLVGELDGVRVYIKGTSIVLTTRELQI